MTFISELTDFSQILDNIAAVEVSSGSGAIYSKGNNDGPAHHSSRTTRTSGTRGINAICDKQVSSLRIAAMSEYILGFSFPSYFQKPFNRTGKF